MPNPKKNKLVRYLKIAQKKSGKLTGKKIASWINTNLKQHPFILGILLFIWINYIIDIFFDSPGAKQLVKSHLKVHSSLILAWFILVIASNLLKDKQKVRWYLKKRFVMLMLVLITPLGLILLWTGSKFKRGTKIIFTVIFIAFFIIGNIYQEKRYESFEKMSPFERVASLFTKQKRKVFLRTLGTDALMSLKLEGIPKKARIKLAVSDMYSRYAPGIVTIKIKDRQGKDIAEGSGFVISKDGFIVTNFHVINSAHEAEIKIGDKVFNDVYLVKGSPNLDVAILKVDAEGLSPLPIGDSDGLSSGQFIVALGNPLGFEQSVSSGIISAIRSGPTIKLIQMTVPVSPGSSGCPVLNEYGEVVGIATIASFFMAQNLNFAVPINYLKETLRKK
jgi:hypothetical protein